MAGKKPEMVVSHILKCMEGRASGTALPSTRDVRRATGFSLVTVGEGLRIMEARKLAVKEGGRYVLSEIASGENAPAHRVLDFALRHGLEARWGFDAIAAHAAAVRVRDGAPEVVVLCRDMVRAIDEAETVHGLAAHEKVDIDNHFALWRASGNLALWRMVLQSRAMLESSIKTSVRLGCQSMPARHANASEHKRTWAYISLGQPVLAREAAEAHISNAMQRLGPKALATALR